MTLFRFFRTVSTVLSVLELAILVYALLSWFAQGTKLYQWLGNFLEPILSPFRAINRLLLGQFHLPFDFSCLIAILSLQLINSIWMDIVYWLLRPHR